ncbi:MAG: secretin N-terminal domain-containing protein [Phycisphaerales bacterium]
MAFFGTPAASALSPTAPRPLNRTAALRLMRAAGLASAIWAVGVPLGGTAAAQSQPPATPPATPPTTPPGEPPADQPVDEPAQPVPVPDQAQPAAQGPAVPERPPVVAPPPAAEPLPADKGSAPGVIVDGDSFQFGPFADGVEMRLLVDLVIAQTKIQVITTDQAVGVLSKKIYFSVPLSVPKGDLLSFLTMLLEQNGASMTSDVAGIYIIKGPQEAFGGIGDRAFDATQLIPTSGLRPSSLTQAIGVVLRGGGGGVPGQPGMAGGPIAYLDDLGVILITDTPRRIELVKQLVVKLAAEQSKQDIAYFELTYIAAPVARQRLLELLGRGGRSGGGLDPIQQAVQAQQQAGGMGGVTNLSNLADRLIPDPQSNSLIFRGRPDEQEFITRLLKVVDKPNRLRPKWYAIGSAAIQLAQHGKRQGLGEIITLPSSRDASGGGGSAFNGLNAGNPQGGAPGQVNTFGSSSQPAEGGSIFLIDPEGRGFIYYGTEQQQEEVQRLADEFKEITAAETVVYEFYKLRHGKAEDIAAIIQELLTNQARPTGGGPLLPGAPAGNPASVNQFRLPRRGETTATPALAASTDSTARAGPGELGAIGASEDIHVGPDTQNNQIFVKAPRRLQPQFARLIEKLDLRRPQVYIEALIVAIAGNETFRLAFENQLIIANGTGGAFNTSFGLSSFATGTGTSATNGAFTGPKSVATGLAGFTGAIIKSEYVPIIINALASNTDTRILARPQLLVDDNEEATVEVKDEQPTTTQSQSGSSSTTLTGFGGFEEAGAKLTVTPQISEGNYMKLNYQIELSSFQGTSTTNASGSVVPPPRLTNKIDSKSVTIPSDSTIVVGGLTSTQTGKTVIKIPLLGDIPIIGQLFQDYNTTETTRTLYIFITPRVMRDPTFNDLRLLTQGPQAILTPEERQDLPTAKPIRIEVLDVQALPAEPAAGGAPRG